MSAVMHGESRPGAATHKPLIVAFAASFAIHGLLLLVSTPEEEPAAKEDIAPPLEARLLPSEAPAGAPAATPPRAEPPAVTPPLNTEKTPEKTPEKKPEKKAEKKPAVREPKPRKQKPRAEKPIQSPAPPARAEPSRPPPVTSPPSTSVATPEVAPPRPTPAAPAAASPDPPTPADDTAPALDAYRRDLLKMAGRYKRYPRVALDNNWEGRVVVQLEVGANGRIAALSVAASAGHAVLDRQALDMIRKAKGAVLIPAALRGRPFRVEIPVIFELKDAS